MNHCKSHQAYKLNWTDTLVYKVVVVLIYCCKLVKTTRRLGGDLLRLRHCQVKTITLTPMALWYCILK